MEVGNCPSATCLQYAGAPPPPPPSSDSVIRVPSIYPRYASEEVYNLIQTKQNNKYKLHVRIDFT